MQATEGEGKSEMEFTDIETMADSLDSSVVFHVVVDILSFVLYMHQQIPSIFQDISLEFDTLRTEYKELEMVLAQTEVKASLRRTNSGRMREVKRRIRRLEKLMSTVSNLKTALQMMICEIPNIQRLILVLGASPVRPQCVYELCFSHGKIVSGSDCDFTKSKAAEGLSRKAIRELISKGAGSDSYAGPAKLFLLVKAPSSFSLPQHFLPKRDFRYSKKIVPFRLRFKCRTEDRELNAARYDPLTAGSLSMMEPASNELIWFQCRHIVKGLAFKTLSTEE